MRKSIARLFSGRNAATAIEYSLVASLIAVAIVGGLQTVGPALTGALIKVPTRVAAAP